MKKLLLALLLLPSLVFGQITGKIISNKPSGGTIIGDTLKVGVLNLKQTTASQTITLGNYTSGPATVYIRNTGSVSVTLSPGTSLPVGNMATIGWNGSTWSTSLITVISEVSNADYNAIAWNGVTTIAPSKNALRDEFENKVSKLTGSVLFDFANTETLNITTDNGGFTRSHIHLADEEMNFGWGDYLLVITGAYSKFVSPGGDVFVPEGDDDTLALKSDITGINSGTNTGDETTARINTLYGYTPANPSTVSAKLDTSLASGKILIGQSYGGAAAKTPSGDVTIDNSGVTTIGALKVTSGMLFGGIGYSKLNLTGAILNADLAGSIAASKLVGTDIATVGTITSGTWNASLLTGTYGGTGVNNGSSTFTYGANTTITGGGTIGLAGFTLTVPATGTAALLGTANVFTADQSHTGNIIPTATNTYDFGANTSTGDWRKLYGRTLGVADASGTNITGTSLNLLAGAGTGTGTETYIGLQTAIKGSSGSTVQSLANTMTVSLLSGSSTYTGIWLKTAPGSRTNSNYVLASDAAGTFLNGSNDVNLSIGGGVKIGITSTNVNLQGTSNVIGGTTGSGVFRLTNAGSDVTASVMLDPAGSVSIAGSLAYAFHSTDGMSFTHANGTRRIRGWSAKLTNLVNTAGSESSDLTWTPQNVTDKFIVAGALNFNPTNTAGGTTGDQTINKASGTVNIAASGTTVTVTNSLCTTSSIIYAVVRTNDTTALIKNVVPGSGSFVINMNAAVTAETSIGFFIIN